MLCFSCGKSKNELHPKKSDIMEGVMIYLCQLCIDNRYEPRWIIILGGRQNGAESVRDYIIKRRYVGNQISAEELIA